MKKIYLFTVVALLVAFIPLRQAHAGDTLGIQGGYIYNVFTAYHDADDSLTRKNLSTKQKQWADGQGGFLEFNYNHTFDFGKTIYLGVGLYFQWMATRNIDLTNKGAPITSSINTGPEVTIGFHLTPKLDVSIRSGIGFAFVNPPFSYTRRGINWRFLPGLTFKLKKVGFLVEFGYQGNWLISRRIYKGKRIFYTYHGVQIGLGVKLYL